MSTQTPLVFVHGNPETSAVWGPLLACLDRPHAVCLSPPGFGAPLPANFDATPAGYREWLIGQLQLFREPVDLVGHDWGGGHVFAAAMARPELIRCWVSDVVGIFDAEYVWHPLAQIWQTEGAGEAWVQETIGAPLATRVDAMRALGIEATVAERLAAGMDADMGRAILSLYRAARQPVMSDAGSRAAAAAAAPGLVLCASADDMTGTAQMRRRVADAAGADVVDLDGLGHWWMVQDPTRSAAVLEKYFAQQERR